MATYSKKRKRSAGVKKRSRNGCHACKKAKIKCDETRPVCMNCQKFKRKCDYSIVLTWGGRPYKKPKKEKLNMIASISREQLQEPVKKIALPFQSVQESLVKPNGEKEPETGVKRLKNGTSAMCGIIGQNKRKKPPVKNILVAGKKVRVKLEPESTEEIRESRGDAVNNVESVAMSGGASIAASTRSESDHIVSPSGNLEYLLRMASGGDVRTQNPAAEECRDADSPILGGFRSLDESFGDVPLEDYRDQQLDTQQSSIGNFGEGIKSVSDALGSIIGGDVVQTNPWAFLEDLGEFQAENMNDGKDEFEGIDKWKRTSCREKPGASDRAKSPGKAAAYSGDGAEERIAAEKRKDEKADKQIEKASVEPAEISSEAHQDVFALHRAEMNDFTDDLENIWRRRTYGKTKIHFSDPLERLTGQRRKIFLVDELESEAPVQSSIPRGIMPLPDILLNVPYYYESFNFFLQSTSLLLTPADPSIYASNPFKTVLPALAMQNEGLMAIMIAYGIAHRTTLLHQHTPYNIEESLMSRALRDLLALLDNAHTSTSDLTLTLVIFLSSFMVFAFSGDKWRVHIKGARQIILMRGYNQPFRKLICDFPRSDSPTTANMSSEIKKSKLLYFLIRWFAYIDIFSSLSSPLEPAEAEIDKFMNRIEVASQGFSPAWTESSLEETIDDEKTATDKHNQQQIDYDVDNDGTFFKDESHKSIDYMLGFNVKFLPLFSKLCKLIEKINFSRRVDRRRRELGLPVSPVFKICPAIIEKSLQIETQFRKLGIMEFDTDKTAKKDSFNSIVASNHCFLLMGMLQLYRRVLQIPRKSTLVQHMSDSIVNVLDNFVDTAKPSSLCLILPIFVGGCECESEPEKALYKTKMRDLVAQGSPSATQATEIMEKCWKTGRDWYEIMHTENRHVVFL
ncbi:hypothetical protein BRETT_001839 [Brettanomyces bruxellensis]|uniref:Zn(2)-C6 fungal-type domain-containing protein n=1 Tax=Dekkera bruxellensis TaxID=5007 RepID=A0A871R9H0_DEKBR|nr:uncharacterized protein BRETT_001839 [Brettanomyces bruxellensis]QOU18770.1 hypothetical protein BRETT_001839 [Brettanomyces bruxellensis]